jgi:hypothetical protein
VLFDDCDAYRNDDKNVAGGDHMQVVLILKIVSVMMMKVVMMIMFPLLMIIMPVIEFLTHWSHWSLNISTVFYVQMKP